MKLKLKKKSTLKGYSYGELKEYKAKTKDKFAKHIYKLDKLIAKVYNKSQNKSKKPVLG